MGVNTEQRKGNINTNVIVQMTDEPREKRRTKDGFDANIYAVVVTTYPITCTTSIPFEFPSLVFPSVYPYLNRHGCFSAKRGVEQWH